MQKQATGNRQQAKLSTWAELITQAKLLALKSYEF